jgi:hypothetical protein
MSEAHESLRLARMWVERAEEDLLVAGRLLSPEENCPYAAICFHAQQSAEKYIKALLVFLATPFPKVHDISELPGGSGMRFGISYRKRHCQPEEDLGDAVGGVAVPEGRDFALKGAMDRRNLHVIGRACNWDALQRLKLPSSCLSSRGKLKRRTIPYWRCECLDLFSMEFEHAFRASANRSNQMGSAGFRIISG